MNDCERLSDRIPEVALHGGEWSAEEASHLATCAECRAEWELALAARDLEARAPTISDPAAVADAVLGRLAADRIRTARARRVWSFAGLAAAAAIVVAVLTGREPATQGGVRVTAEVGALVPLPELEGLETAQLDTLLRSLDRPVAGGSALDASTLGEYEDGELEQVFATWEG
jgi:predicted anti-sigma-YlaC factor YlaD